MAWLTSLQNEITISEDRYIETRTNPDDDTKEQYRRRETRIKEYRGLTLEAAQNALIGYPIISAYETTTRSFAAIGGGGYTVTTIADVPVGNWTDF